MASPSVDMIAQCFKKGAKVEISSNDDGFRGSWYLGTVIRPPRNVRKPREKVLVEYKTLMEDDAGKQPLREDLELVQLRPPPPREGRRRFKFSDEVDAYYNDGWWEGVVAKVDEEEDTYMVFFKGTREQIAFGGSDLRVHREWVYGMWVPPLEQDCDESHDEKMPLPAEVKQNKEGNGHNFSPGEPVEVSSDEDDFEGAWFEATIVKKLEEGKYLVQYQRIRNDDDSDFLTEEVDSLHIRPSPPDVGLVDRFAAREVVDALYNDVWWAGVIAKVLNDEKYSVYFKTTDETLKFKHSNLRVHQEWMNGKWVIPHKVQI